MLDITPLLAFSIAINAAVAGFFYVILVLEIGQL